MHTLAVFSMLFIANQAVAPDPAPAAEHAPASAVTSDADASAAPVGERDDSEAPPPAGAHPAPPTPESSLDDAEPGPHEPADVVPTPSSMPALPPAPATQPHIAVPPADKVPAQTERTASAAQTALDVCLTETLSPAETETCLELVVARFPGTPAASSAATGLAVMKRAQPAEANSLLPAFLKPGHLELATVAGVYGVWAGITGGVLAGTNADQYMFRLDPWAIVLGTGVTAVALGLGGAAAGYALASGVKIDRGYAWSTTAGMTWGLSYAVALIPAAYDLVAVPWYVQDELNFAVPLVGGGAGAALGFGLAHVLRPDIAEVSMMNTGGWIGGAYGLIIGINASAWGPQNAKYGLLNATTYTLGKSAGLLAGAAASQLLRYTWGETLLGDFGAALGIILFGATSFAFVSSPWAEPLLETITGEKDDGELFGKIAITTVSTSVGVGMAAGLAATTAGLVVFHKISGAPVLRDDAFGFALKPLVSVVGNPATPTDLTPVYGVYGAF